jgi:hypothetical protein
LIYIFSEMSCFRFYNLLFSSCFWISIWHFYNKFFLNFNYLYSVNNKNIIKCYLCTCYEVRLFFLLF